MSVATCRGTAPAGPAGAADSAGSIIASVEPSAGDAHLALLPPPVQAFIQLRPFMVLSDPTLSVAGEAFLAAIAADPSSAAACLRSLAHSAQALTYAWIGGDGDGWLLLVDGPLDAATERTCLEAIVPARMGDPPPDPAVGSAVALGDHGELLFARMSPVRRAVGSEATVKASLAMAAGTPPGPDAATAGDEPGGHAPLWPRLRQGEIKVYTDVDELGAIGADFLPMAEDADQIALVLRLEERRARAVALVRARSSSRMASIEEALRGALAGLRRAALDDPRISPTDAYRMFEDANPERDGDVVRIEVSIGRPGLAAIARWFATRILHSRYHPPGAEDLQTPPPPDPDAGSEPPEAGE